MVRQVRILWAIVRTLAFIWSDKITSFVVDKGLDHLHFNRTSLAAMTTVVCRGIGRTWESSWEVTVIIEARFNGD